MRIAFLGTPEFAVPSLKALIERGDTLHVFTQPDRPVGRKAVLTPPAVKQYAVLNNVPVSQFEKIRSDEGVLALEAFAPDLMVTAAFGQLLSARNLAVPKLGTINVHGSLLPRYRGASPIQAAILNGDPVTGITTMFTDIGMDTGDILLQKQVAIGPDETYGSLSERLSIVGAELLLDTLSRLEAGTLVRTPQNAEYATVCHMIKKQDAALDFHASAQSIHNKIRAMNPWPVSYAMLDGQPFKIYASSLTDFPAKNDPGSLLVSDGHLFVSCSDHFLEILSVQVPGKKRQDAKTFLLGNQLNGKQLL